MDDRSKVIKMIRGCLDSFKGQMTPAQLDKDFRCLIGEKIPYAKLGYSNLESFLSSIPELTLKPFGNGHLIYLQPSESTKHIVNMVKAQKTTKKSQPPRRQASSWKGFPRKPQNNRPSSNTSRNRLKEINNNDKSRVPPRFGNAPTPSRYPSSGVNQNSRFTSSSMLPTSNTKSFNPPKKDHNNYYGNESSTTLLRTRQEVIDINTKKPPQEFNYSSNASSAVQKYASDNVDVKKQPPKMEQFNYSNTSSAVQKYVSDNVDVKKPPPKKEFNYSSNASSVAQKRCENDNNVNSKKPQLKLSILPKSPVDETGFPNTKKPQFNKPTPTVENFIITSQINQPSQVKFQKVSPEQIPPSNTRTRPSLCSRSLMAYQNIYATNVGPQKFTVPINQNLAKPKPKIPKSFPNGPSPPNTGQYANLLATFCRDNDLPDPVYKVVSHKPKKQAEFFLATVHIGTKQFGSLPDGGKSGAEAQEIASKKALNQLKETTKCLLSETRADSNLLSTRIFQLVSSYSNGFWSNEIPPIYKKQFNETLPKNWFNLIQNCPVLDFEMISQDKYIIRVKVAPSDDIPSEDDEAMHHITESIVVPNSPAWDVFITCADSTEEVWLRLIGPEYSDEYNNMSTDMEMFYMKPKQVNTNTLYVGGLYALIQDGNWHRVRLTEMLNDGSNECLVFFIDHGDEERSKIENLYPLESRFKRLPPQAIPCHLSGLEEFRNESCVPPILVQHIIGRSLVAEVISSPNQDGNEDVTFGIILYDTTTEDDINLNDVITDEIVKQLQEPQLEEDNIQEIFLSHVSPEGIVYLQHRSDIQSYVEKLLSQFGELTNSENEILPLRNDEQPLYLLFPDPESGESFKRCQILNYDAQKAKVFLVDEGPTLTVPATRIIPLDQFDSPLNKIPKQAIAASLYQVVKFDESIMERIRELCPINEPVLVRSVARNKNRGDVLPIIELFKRIEPDRFLVSINADLANFKAFETLNDASTVDKATERKQRIQRLSSLTLNLETIKINPPAPSNPSMTSNIFTGKRYGLPVPEMPTIGNLIDVYVSIVASPSNFIVQPLVYQPQLRTLLTEMNSTYEQLYGQKTSTETIQNKKVYAVKNTDDIWYRASVVTLLNSSASVYFCDFGDVAIIPFSKFMPLLPQFKELPFQAIKASLSGVEPKHQDWSVVDCLAFKEIVYEKQFVAKVTNIASSAINTDETIFSLELIDTSGNTDIYIHQQLIEQDRARAIPLTKE